MIRAGGTGPENDATFAFIIQKWPNHAFSFYLPGGAVIVAGGGALAGLLLRRKEISWITDVKIRIPGRNGIGRISNPTWDFGLADSRLKGFG